MPIKILTLALILISSYNSAAAFEICTSIPINSQLKTVQTLNGQIKGECKIIPVSYSNGSKVSSNVFSWLSIPYAETPIDQNRFKNPIPVRTWAGIKDGTQLPNSCFQIAETPTQISEDCLYLNVFVRSDVYLNKNKTLNPMLIFIHGGSFVTGSSADPLFEPSTVVAMSGIVVVTINYRLDAFGFLSLSGTDSTGNQGFFDQSLAIKWVYDNGKYFGGDSSKITIQGESAGAISVGYHLLYPGSWPYFKNAIMESGSPTIKGSF